MDPAQAIELELIAKNSIINETIQRGDSTLQQFYENAVIFLTGGTGFLGKHLIEKLLRSCNVKKIFVLVRPKKEKTAEMRLAQLIDDPVFECLRTMKPDYASKICVILGDTGELSLGMTTEDTRNITEEVNFIFHVAATTSFVETLKKATLTNIRGTRETLNLAKHCKKLKAFIHVSTAYCHGIKRHIGKTMREEFQPPPIKPELMIQIAEQFDNDALHSMTPTLLGEWPNTYSFTKAISEDLVGSMVDQFPIAVIRPAIVVAAHHEPSPGWLDPSCVYGATGVALGTGLGILHVLNSRVDVSIDYVPVDLVNNATIAAGQKTAVRWKNGHKDIKIYTLTGNRNPLTLRQYTEILEECRPLTTDKTVWYSYLIHVESFTLYFFLFWILHFIPAYLVDAILVLMRKRPMMGKVYKKAFKLSSTLSYYLRNDWIYEDSNLYTMYKELSHADQIIYNSDMADLDWFQYVQIWCIGVRKYIIKDGINNTEYGVKKQFWLKIVHYIVMPLYIYCLFKVFYLFCFCFFGIFSYELYKV